MKKLAQLSATLMLAAVVLAGCGGDGEDDDAKAGDPAETASEPAPSEPTDEPSEELPATDWGKPATGPRLTGDGYAYRVPKGWGDISKQAAKMQSYVDTAASEKSPTDGFADNINVGFQPATDATLDQLEAALPTQLRGLVKDLETMPRVTVDGVEALHHRGPAVSGGTKYFLEQFAALRDGRIAIITFSFSRDLSASQRDPVVAAVMASWSWTA